jgi:hypothetical protein
VQTLLDWLVTAVGVAVVATALRDIFHTLWHPTGRGGLSRRVMAAVWRAGRGARRRGEAGSLAGPLAMVAVVLTWTALVVGGAALAYWPHMTEGFALGSSLDADQRGGFPDALYLSVVTTATLGFGDVVPTAGWLRIAVPVQAFIGFVLLTAAVTWVLQLYPALIRRRALAVRLATLRDVDTAAMLGSEDGTLAVQVLDGLAGSFSQTRVDLTQYAETYYFRDGAPESSLPAMAPVAAELAGSAEQAPSGDVRLAGAVLGAALADYLRVVDEHFLHRRAPVGELLTAYAADHGVVGGREP